MVLVKGICKNFGECDLADNKEIQEVEKTNFVCSNPDCGKPLHEIKPTKPPKSPVIWIVAAVLLVCGIGVATYWYSRHSDDILPTPVPIERIVVNPTECCLNVGDSVLVTVGVYPPGATDNMVWISSNPDVAIISDGLIKALSEGRTTVVVSTNDGIISSSISINVVTRTVEPSPTPLPSSKTDWQRPIPVVIPDDLQETLDFLINESITKEIRLNSIVGIIDKFFEPSAKVRTLGDSGITLDYENVEDCLRRIILSRRIAEVQLLEQEMRDKITEISIREINK